MSAALYVIDERLKTLTQRRSFLIDTLGNPDFYFDGEEEAVEEDLRCIDASIRTLEHVRAAVVTAEAAEYIP